MSGVTLTIGEADFQILFNMINETTGGAFDLTGFVSRLFIKTTDFATDIVPGGIALTIVGVVTDGVLSWAVQASHIPTSAGQFYGQIVHTNSGSGEIRKSRRFNIQVERSLSS